MDSIHLRIANGVRVALSTVKISTQAISAPFFVVAFAALVSPITTLAAESPIVVESRNSSAVTYQVPVMEPDSTPGSPSGLEAQYQLQLLQQEVMQLRGTVEQLQYELNQMKAVADDRYLELDGRLQGLLTTSQPSADNPVPSIDSEAPADSTITRDVEGLSEKEIYDTAQLLIRNRQYEMAITQLDSLIAQYPDGEYTPNAYYWLGQVYAAKSNPDFEKARQALAQVISFFPDHGKVPDAAFALGKVYHTLGDCTRAQDLLQQVVDQYPGKSAAKLAENYLRESLNCEP